MAEPRTKIYLRNGLKNWLAFQTPETFNLSSSTFDFKYVKDTSRGCLVSFKDPAMGTQYYEVTVRQIVGPNMPR